MTKIFGHRGAAGLALENSEESIRAALSQKVDAVEFDVRRTRDSKLVVLHDAHTGRVANKKVDVDQATLDELRQLRLRDGHRIPTLDDVLDIVGTNPIILEIKDEDSVGELVQTLRRHPRANVTLASFQHNELRLLHERLPDLPMYVLEHFSPIDIIHSAVHLGANGIGLNKWLMNPFTYYLARHNKLELYVYTLNSRWLGNLFLRFYPDVTICTDHPERFADIREQRP